MAKVVELRAQVKPLALAVASAFFSAGVAAQTAPGALPAGGQVTAGGATLTYSPGKLQIDQSTNKAILQWDTFSIGSSAWVNFSQPSSSSVALNRVTGTNPSEIFGRLTANGQVFLTNPNGVLFAPGASVDVGGLFATTLSIADSDFLAGRYNFYNAGGAGSVINQGNIVTTNGYAALAGPQVRNDGVIIARAGSVALAAGDRVTLDMVGDGLIKVSVDQAALNASAVNAGSIEADGRAILTARSANALLDTVVNNTGIVRANSLVERNGEIILDGGSAAVASSGVLDASLPGGTVRISGGDVSVSNTVTSGGALAMDAAGTVTISNANVHSFGGQSISGRAVRVTASSGGFTNLWNSGPGEQRITAADGDGIDVRGEGGFVQVFADGGSNQTINVVNGDHITVDRASVIAQNSSQRLSITGSGANAIRMGSVGAAGSSIAHGSMHQSVIAGGPGESGSITIIGPGVNSALAGLFTNPNPGGTQTISTSGLISVTGGNATNQPSNFFSGINHNGSGLQTITAGGIQLTAGSVGSGNVAVLAAFGGGVAANSGDQVIHVPGGEIRLTAGAGGLGNRASIQALANQTIDGDPDIFITGGAGGTGGTATNTQNNAFINAGTVGRTQQIHAHDLWLNGGSGRDAVAGMGGATQFIIASGDVHLTGGDGPGTPVARIGNGLGFATNLTLQARNVVLTGGATGEAGLGSSGVGAAQPSTININAAQDVILNAGAAPARIGSSLAFATPLAGNVSITAGHAIQLNGGTAPAVIRTAEAVWLSAGAIQENSNGWVQATSLNTSSFGNTTLIGGNKVATFNGSAFGGDLSLSNTAALTVANLGTSGTATLANTGAVSVTGPWSSGPAYIVTTGPGADLTLNGGLFSSGALTADVSGQVAVRSGVFSTGGQEIHAQGLSVLGAGASSAQLNNSGGNQTIVIAGGPASAGIDVTASAGGFATITNNGSGAQVIQLVGADHFNVDGAGGPASVFNFNGPQTISLTGSGHNAVTLGSTGALGQSFVGGASSQSVIAGLAGEQGSITIVGTGATNSLAGLVTNQVPSGTQTISTSGAIRITGGTAPNQASNFATGIFHNGGGEQTITARSITLNGGPSGNNNVALIRSGIPNNPALQGNQVIHVAELLELHGGGAGINNRAIITSNANQTIDGDPTIRVIGGDGGGADLAGNNAAITTAIGRSQTIRAADIELRSGAGGVDNSAAIQGGVQNIRAIGDVLIVGGASGGLRNAALIGGAPSPTVLQPTNLVLEVGRDLILVGGSATNTSASIGSSAFGTGQPRNDITITAGRDVSLTSGSAAGARIGTSAIVAPTEGTISISAGGNIALNGGAQPTAIRTLGDVSLSAGGTISEGANGLVLANTLSANAGAGMALVGSNQLNRFSGTSDGDLALVNTSPLLMLPAVQTNGGSFTLRQAGDASFVGNATVGAMDVSATGSVYVLGGAAATDVVAAGPMMVVTGGDLAIAGGSGAGAFGALRSYSDINLTIGGDLRINAGTGSGAYGRLQTMNRDSAINVFFPNLASGGYFVNDIDGALRRGLTGILSGEGVAVPGQTLFFTYGE